MKKSFFSLLVSVCVLMTPPPLMLFARAQQNSVSAGNTQDSRLMSIFWGIVGYTRWPDTKGALRICLSGDDQHSAMIRQSAIKLGHRVATLSEMENTATTCDIVYVSGTGMDEVGELSRSLAGAPVLSIGDGGKFCSMGGMFCLLSGKEKNGHKNIDRFAVNLDAISRSTLRIDPQVLRLSKDTWER
ncbi:MAG: YfiR family protein [Azoarcus sp.]|nr:YfiR family protein [Azoarcus sp.]